MNETDTIHNELTKVSELIRDLDTFIAGCETGGNRGGAKFAQSVKWKLEASTKVIRSANNRMDNGLKKAEDRVQLALAEAEDMKQKADEKVKKAQAKMDKLKRSIEAAQATRKAG